MGLQLLNLSNKSPELGQCTSTSSAQLHDHEQTQVNAFNVMEVRPNEDLYQDPDLLIGLFNEAYNNLAHTPVRLNSL